MIDSISKPALPKGLSYVLKTSQLAKALSDSCIDCHVDLVYWSPRVGGSILEAHYWLPSQFFDYPRVHVRAGTVHSEFRHEASTVLLATALPGFVRWLQHILGLPPQSPELSNYLYFNATYLDGSLNVTTEVQHKAR